VNTTDFGSTSQCASKENRIMLASDKSRWVLGKLGLAFRGHEFETSANRGNYVEMLKLLGNYDADL
jgi:hypothetical protein